MQDYPSNDNTLSRDTQMPTERRHALLYLTGATLSYAGTALVPVAMSFAVLDTGHGAHHTAAARPAVAA